MNSNHWPIHPEGTRQREGSAPQRRDAEIVTARWGRLANMCRRVRTAKIIKICVTSEFNEPACTEESLVGVVQSATTRRR